MHKKRKIREKILLIDKVLGEQTLVGFEVVTLVQDIFELLIEKGRGS